MNRKYKLRIELEDFTGQKRYAEYTTFSVRPATDNYRLTVGGYSGNAGMYMYALDKWQVLEHQEEYDDEEEVEE